MITRREHRSFIVIWHGWFSTETPEFSISSYWLVTMVWSSVNYGFLQIITHSIEIVVSVSIIRRIRVIYVLTRRWVATICTCVLHCGRSPPFLQILPLEKVRLSFLAELVWSGPISMKFGTCHLVHGRPGLDLSLSFLLRNGRFRIYRVRVVAGADINSGW